MNLKICLRAMVNLHRTWKNNRSTIHEKSEFNLYDVQPTLGRGSTFVTDLKPDNKAAR